MYTPIILRTHIFRFVLDALRKPINSNMSWFGLVALDRFKARLKDYSQYCQHVASIQHFKVDSLFLWSWRGRGWAGSREQNTQLFYYLIMLFPLKVNLKN